MNQPRNKKWVFLSQNSCGWWSVWKLVVPIGGPRAWVLIGPPSFGCGGGWESGTWISFTLASSSPSGPWMQMELRPGGSRSSGWARFQVNLVCVQLLRWGGGGPGEAPLRAELCHRRASRLHPRNQSGRVKDILVDTQPDYLNRGQEEATSKRLKSSKSEEITA